MQRLLLCSLLALGLAACGGDKSTGPSDADIGGSWRITFTNMSGFGVSCNSNAFPLQITQSGSTFTGSYGLGTFTCTGPGGSTSVDVEGVVVNGTVDINAVAFDLDTQDAHQTGSVSGNSMSGTAWWRLDLGGGQIITFNGNWSAVKQ